MKLAEVVQLYGTNASDIVAMLRQTADNIEDGAPCEKMIAIAVGPDGAIDVYAWGKVVDADQAIGIMARASNSIMSGSDE